MSDATLLQPLRALELALLESIYAHRLLSTTQLDALHATCDLRHTRRLLARLRRRVLPTPEGAAGALQSHTLAVNDVGVAFAVWARRRGHECRPLGWTNEVAHRFGDTRGDLLVADALLHYTATLDGRVALLSRFVELDRATMSTQEVGAKLRSRCGLAAAAESSTMTGTSRCSAR
jgi:hypothetical protein